MLNKRNSRIKPPKPTSLQIEYVEDGLHPIYNCNTPSAKILESYALNKNIEKDKERVYYINGLTFFRNFMSVIEGSVPEKKYMLKTTIYKNKLKEMFGKDLINFLQASYSLKLIPIFYYLTYKKPTKVWFNFKDKTELSEGFEKYYVINYGYEFSQWMYNNLKQLWRYKNDYKLIKNRKLAAITTHLAFDLLNFKNDKNVLLLESFTGEIKDYTGFNGKFHPLGKKDLSIIPFNEVTLRVFGDETFIDPFKVKTREYIYKLAIRLNWYPNMSERDVLNSLSTVDKPLVKELKETLKPYLFW